jgi:ubiquinone biosynthesis protein UbiJ
MKRNPLTYRQEAEAIEQFGDDLAALNRAFDRLCERMSPGATDAINDIADQDKIDTIAEAFRALGDRLCRLCDAAEEAEDRRRDNPLEPDFRRLAQ